MVMSKKGTKSSRIVRDPEGKMSVIEQDNLVADRIKEAIEWDAIEQDKLVADRIKEAIEDVYGTVADGIPFIEDALLVSKRSVYKWIEDGKIRLSHARSLAEHLDVTLGWLLAGESPSFGSPKRIPDRNVLSFSKRVTVKQVDPDLDAVEKTLFVRQVPIIEADEVVNAVTNDPTQWVKTIKDFVSDPKRAYMSISHYNTSVGLPTYAFQVITDWWGPTIRMGETCAMATDIVPTIGDFTTYAVYDHKAKHYIFTAGFFYPLDFHTDARNLNSSYKYIESFVLKVKQEATPPAPGDLEVGPHNRSSDYPPLCVGVMTYSTYWHSKANRDWNTGLAWRVQQAHSLRSLKERSSGTSKFGHDIPDDNPDFSEPPFHVSYTKKLTEPKKHRTRASIINKPK